MSVKQAKARLATISEAANKTGIPRQKICDLLKREVIKATADPLDRRVKLVDLNELEALKVR